MMYSYVYIIIIIYTLYLNILHTYIRVYIHHTKHEIYNYVYYIMLSLSLLSRCYLIYIYIIRIDCLGNVFFALMLHYYHYF